MIRIFSEPDGTFELHARSAASPDGIVKSYSRVHLAGVAANVAWIGGFPGGTPFVEIAQPCKVTEQSGLCLIEPADEDHG